MGKEVTYVASKTMREFHKSKAFVRGLMGPIGSGKSVACVMEMIRISKSQAPHVDGVRYTRWVVVRNTYRELLDTTMETFFDWIPKSLGHYSALNSKFVMHTMLEDGTIMHAEFLFRALDRPDDVKKLLSLEMTGMWINEAREIPKAIVDMGIGRLGRYPSKRMGGPSWHGLIMDTNPPDSDHWWHVLFEEALPHNHEIFRQPSGTSPEAENIHNLPEGYYQNMQQGKDREWINVYVHGKYGFVQDGKPVYPEYKDDVHATSEEIVWDRTDTLYIGIDFGLTPAAVFGTRNKAGRWLILDELVCEDMGAIRFGQELHRKILHEYSDCKIEIYGDPSGDQRAQTDETTPFQILAAQGITAWPTYTNDPVIRREATAAPLIRMDFAGNPGYLIGPKAKILRKAKAGGYKYKRVAVTGMARFKDEPDKNRYSHVSDAEQYMMIGAGEGSQLIQSKEWSNKIDYSNTNRMIT